MTDQRFNAKNHCTSNTIKLDMSSLYSPFLRMGRLVYTHYWTRVYTEATSSTAAHGRVVLALALRHLPLPQLPPADTHGDSDNDNRGFCFSLWSAFSLGLYQWGRRLEGWPNTAARLAGWRRVTRQVWFCMWWTGHTACLFRNIPLALTRTSSWKLTEFPADL